MGGLGFEVTPEHVFWQKTVGELVVEVVCIPLADVRRAYVDDVGQLVIFDGAIRYEMMTSLPHRAVDRIATMLHRRDELAALGSGVDPDLVVNNYSHLGRALPLEPIAMPYVEKPEVFVAPPVDIPGWQAGIPGRGETPKNSVWNRTTSPPIGHPVNPPIDLGHTKMAPFDVGMDYPE